MSARVGEEGDDWTVLPETAQLADDALAFAAEPSPYSFTSSTAGLTRAHWRHRSEREACAYCSTAFSLVNKREWCRRCGDIFCKKCVAYRRKLGLNAGPDTAEGVLSRVCLMCYTGGNEKQPVGVLRRRTKLFAQWRLASRSGLGGHVNGGDGKSYGEGRHNIGAVTAACARITQGFMATSRITRAALGHRATWANVNFADVTAEDSVKKASCECGRSFSLLRCRRYHCHVCGCVKCDACLFASLQVYAVGDNAAAELDVLKPGTERKGSVVLRGCDDCVSVIETLLRRRKTSSMAATTTASTTTMSANSAATLAVAPPSSQDPTTMTFRLVAAEAADASAARLRVQIGVGEYANLVDSLENGTESVVAGRRGSVTALAKRQTDLNEDIASLEVRAARLRTAMRSPSLRPTESRVLRSAWQHAALFYADYVRLFRKTRARLAAVLPADSLEAIQREHDLATLRCAYVVVQQLAIESLGFNVPDLATGLGAAADTLATAVIDALDTSNMSLDLLVAEMGRTSPMLLTLAGRPWSAVRLDVYERIDRVLRTSLAQVAERGMLPSPRF
eukprot:UC1_evm1s1459